VFASAVTVSFDVRCENGGGSLSATVSTYGVSKVVVLGWLSYCCTALGQPRCTVAVAHCMHALTQEFIKSRGNKPAELIAKFIDKKLRQVRTYVGSTQPRTQAYTHTHHVSYAPAHKEIEALFHTVCTQRSGTLWVFSTLLCTKQYIAWQCTHQWNEICTMLYTQHNSPSAGVDSTESCTVHV
jgi:hypothetical protein